MSKSSNRFLELDVFRGIAALIVVLYHYTTWYDVNYHHSPNFHLYFPFGRHGIEFFFVISGFVILLTLEKIEKSLDFIIGRFSRLYPSYWIAVALTFIVVKITQLPIKPPVSFWDALLNLTMLQSFFNVPHVDGVYWTLGIELCFYIVMFIIYKAKLLKHIDLVATGWFVVALCYSLASYASHWKIFLEINSNKYYLSISQMSSDSQVVTTVSRDHPDIKYTIVSFVASILILKFAHLFICGMMLYKEKQQEFSRYRWLLIVACILKQRVAYSQEASWNTTLTLAVFVLILYLATRGYLYFITFKPMVFLGTISYGFYLIHQNIGYAIIRGLYQCNVNPYISIAVAIFVSLGLAIAITFLVEKPAIKFIRKSYSSK